MAYRAKHGEPGRFLREVALPYEGDDCLIWPYGRTKHGYGQLGHRGKNVHVFVCEYANGPAPEGKDHACHDCGNPACCNPRHLRWDDRKGNMADRITHGTANRGERHGKVKLTEPEVRRVAALRGVLSQSEISKRFGIHQSTVSNIFTGKRWGWLAKEGHP